MPLHWLRVDGAACGGGVHVGAGFYQWLKSTELEGSNSPYFILVFPCFKFVRFQFESRLVNYKNCHYEVRDYASGAFKDGDIVLLFHDIACYIYNSTTATHRSAGPAFTVSGEI